MQEAFDVLESIDSATQEEIDSLSDEEFYQITTGAMSKLDWLHLRMIPKGSLKKINESKRKRPEPTKPEKSWCSSWKMTSHALIMNEGKKSSEFERREIIVAQEIFCPGVHRWVMSHPYRPTKKPRTLEIPRETVKELLTAIHYRDLEHNGVVCFPENGILTDNRPFGLYDEGYAADFWYGERLEKIFDRLVDWKISSNEEYLTYEYSPFVG